MRTTHMQVLLTPAQWEELRVEDNELFVTSAFYLALPYTYIAHRVKYKMFDEERQSVIESAQELGLTERDKVIKLQG